MHGIICDVGHTIITDSILNQILLTMGKNDAVAKLYDEEMLHGKNQEVIDDWVKKVSSYKINSLKGVSVDDIEKYCQLGKFTRGLKEFVNYVTENDIPILFIGAVPVIITKSLLKAAGITLSGDNDIYVEGTSVQLVNNNIDKPIKICTPSVKKQIVEDWAKTLGLNNHDLLVIGDSLGDIPTMQLTKRENRYGIHVNSMSLKSMIDVELKDFNDMHGIIKRKINNMVEAI